MTLSEYNCAGQFYERARACSQIQLRNLWLKYLAKPTDLASSNSSKKLKIWLNFEPTTKAVSQDLSTDSQEAFSAITHDYVYNCKPCTFQGICVENKVNL